MEVSLAGVLYSVHFSEHHLTSKPWPGQGTAGQPCRPPAGRGEATPRRSRKGWSGESCPSRPHRHNHVIDTPARDMFRSWCGRRGVPSPRRKFNFPCFASSKVQQRPRHSRAGMPSSAYDDRPPWTNWRHGGEFEPSPGLPKVSARGRSGAEDGEADMRAQSRRFAREGWR